MARSLVFPARLLNALAVHGGEGVAGAYTAALWADLPCLLGIASTGGGKTSEERADLAQMRTLVWTAAFTMPDAAQVAVGGIRYNVIPGTYAECTWLDGSVVYRCCDVMRAK